MPIWCKRRGFFVSCKLQEPCAGLIKYSCKAFCLQLCVLIRRLTHNMLSKLINKLIVENLKLVIINKQISNMYSIFDKFSQVNNANLGELNKE